MTDLNQTIRQECRDEVAREVGYFARTGPYKSWADYEKIMLEDGCELALWEQDKKAALKAMDRLSEFYRWASQEGWILIEWLDYPEHESPDLAWISPETQKGPLSGTQLYQIWKERPNE